ncbi:hypothetical protein KAR91_15765 [Candidatus Pacearchaeota archaeon]|nr:hypothetical protein [Candidatus Pacearchaeota archaeon]
MTLKEIRAKFVALSGRLDLMDSYGYDNGADFFINGGIRLLNRLTSDHFRANAYELESDDDECFWSLEHPDILIHAALCRLEVSYRNTAGVKDWMISIKNDLADLDMEWIEELTEDLDVMED